MSDAFADLGAGDQELLDVSGDKDIGNPTATSMKNALTGDPPGAFLFYHKTVGEGSVPGHLTLMTHPNA